MAVRIVVDSTADYSAKELETRGMECIPMTVTFGTEQYQDGIDLSKEEFFEKLINGSEFPTTSQPSPAAFVECFERAKEAGDSLVVILVSSALSGTVQSAHLAKSMVEYDEIYIVDSHIVTLGIRLLADQAVLMQRQGCTAEEIVQRIESLRDRVRVWAGLDTLEYLYRGGRLSRMQASLGKLVNIKPIITFDEEGCVDLCGKQLGMRHVCKQIGKLVQEDLPDTDYPVYYLYAHDKKNAVAFQQTLVKMGMDFGEPKTREIGPTVGTHIGPGAFGIVYLRRES